MSQFKHPLEDLQDAAALGTPIPVVYPAARWQPVDESMLTKRTSLRPSDVDVWLWYPSKPAQFCIQRCINWSGWESDLADLIKDGARLWCPCDDPLPPVAPKLD